MSEYYILENQNPVPADWRSYAEWKRNDPQARRVALTELPNGVRISTVFLGLDHNYGLGLPLLFETMIFEGPHDEYCERYSCWSDAEAGHAKAVALASD